MASAIVVWKPRWPDADLIEGRRVLWKCMGMFAVVCSCCGGVGVVVVVVGKKKFPRVQGGTSLYSYRGLGLR
jgi:hypothetical protein